MKNTQNAYIRELAARQRRPNRQTNGRNFRQYIK